MDRLTTVVVLPTPPFWLAQAMIWPTQAPISVVGTFRFYHSGPFPGSERLPRRTRRVPSRVTGDPLMSALRTVPESTWLPLTWRLSAGVMPSS